jgi:DNA-binding CsgD family transcriptional regulator
MRTEDITAKINLAESTDELQRIADGECRDMGFDGFYYFNYEPAIGLDEIDNRPAEWLDRYSRGGYFHFDVITAHATKSVVPFTWEEAASAYNLGKAQKMLMDEARDFGLKNGFNVSSHGAGYRRATSCFYAEDSRYFFEAIRTDRDKITSIGHAIHERFETLRGPAPEPPALSSRERECLSWAAKGKTNEEIGTILSISANTVNSYIQSAAAKIGVRTKIHTVVKAIQLQLIFPI